jgi:hypothetical protein
MHTHIHTRSHARTHTHTHIATRYAGVLVAWQTLTHAHTHAHTPTRTHTHIATRYAGVLVAWQTQATQAQVLQPSAHRWVLVDSSWSALSAGMRARKFQLNGTVYSHDGQLFWTAFCFLLCAINVKKRPACPYIVPVLYKQNHTKSACGQWHKICLWTVTQNLPVDSDVYQFCSSQRCRITRGVHQDVSGRFFRSAWEHTPLPQK